MAGNDAQDLEKSEAKKLKSQLGGHYKALKERLDNADRQFSISASLKTDFHIKRMREQFSKAESSMETIRDIYTKLLALEETSDQTTKTYEGWVGTFNKTRDQFFETEQAIVQPAAAQNLLQPVGPQGSARPGEPKANDLLKPKDLEYDDKPSVLRLWKEDFTDYYEKNRMDLMSTRVQQKYFVQCISHKLRMKLRNLMRDDTPVLAIKKKPNEAEKDSCFKFLDDIFRASYPIVRRRQEFFNYTQSPNQKTSDYMDKLHELFNEGEFQDIKPDELLTFKAIQGCTVEPARTKFVRETAPDFKGLYTLAQTIEAGENSLVDLQPASANQAQASAKKTSNYRCRRCNGRDKSNHKDYQCKFKDTKCFDCDQVGHIKGSAACNKPKGKAGAKQVDTEQKPEPVTANFVRANSVTVVAEDASDTEGLTEAPHAFVKAIDSSGFEFDNPTPRMTIEVLESNTKFECQALPDTGCTKTLLSLDHVLDNDIQIYPASMKLFAADGEEMPIEGAATIRIKHEGLEIETETLVSSALNNEAVISWQDLQSLEVISKDFPHRDPTLMDHSGQPRREPAIQTGTHVVIRNTATMRWDIAGTVQAVHVNGPCLLVRLEDRRTFIFRNRDHIRPTGIE